MKIIDTIGFLELSSIAKGIEAADAMIKRADVRLVFAKCGCPGKYYIMISGETAEVKSSINAGEEYGGSFVVESLVVPRLHPQVIEAINQCVPAQPRNAVGIMEFFSVTQAVISADSAVKAAEITLVDLRMGIGIGGKSFVVITGETAAVEQGVSAGTKAAESSGMLIARVVIPNPSPEIFDSLY